MNQNLVSFQIEAAGIGDELSARRQIQNDSGPVSVVAVAEMMGQALARVQSKMLPADEQDVAGAFFRGYLGYTE